MTFSDVFISIQPSAGVGLLERRLYMALISPLIALVRRTGKKRGSLAIHPYHSRFLSICHIIDRTVGEAEALLHPSRGERGTEMVPLEFDCHTG